MTKFSDLGEMKQRRAGYSSGGICQQVGPRGKSAGQIELMELVGHAQRKSTCSTTRSSLQPCDSLATPAAPPINAKVPT